MKKIIFSALFSCLFIFNAQAQDDDKANEAYNDWQVRARAVYVAPAPYFYRNVDNVEVDISAAIAPEVGVSYFFSRKMSAELMVNMSSHDVEVEGGSNLGSITLLSPTLALQHHFYVSEKFKPYAGAGVNYTAYMNEDAGDLESIEYENGIGFLLQAGINYDLSDKLFINFDFRKMFLRTEVTGDNDSSSTSEVNVDPIILGLGIGFKF